MAQGPLQIDAIRVEPGFFGTRTIDRDSSGSLRFTDPDVPGGITLAGLAGLRSVASILVVGKGGPGAQYDTLQAAVDAVPPTSSLTAPTLILVGPGLYQENLVIEKDGVWIVGLGGVVIEAAVADPTLTIQASVTVTPQWCRLQNLRVLNANAGESCVSVLGGVGSEVGAQEISLIDCDLVASGASSIQVLADTINNLRVMGGTFEGSASTSLVRATNCHQVSLSSIEKLFNLQLDYNTANPTPDQVGCSYTAKNSTLWGNILSTLIGTGTLELGSLLAPTTAGDLTVNGDGSGSFRAAGCRLRNLSLNGSAPLTLASCTRGSAAGSGTLAEDIQEGTASFSAASSKSVVFGVPQPDANYTVHPETELTSVISVTSKTAAGFTLGFSTPQTTTVSYKILRRAL